MTPLERLVGPLPKSTGDYRDDSDALSEAVLRAARDRDQFVEVLSEEPLLLENGTVVFALGAIDDARLVPLLVGSLGSKSSNVRWAAANALAARRDPRVVDAFIDALRDRAPTVRAVVIEALGKMRAKRALAPLEEALARPGNQKDDYLRKLLEGAVAKLRK